MSGRAGRSAARMAAAGALLAAIACADGADEDRGGAPEDAAPTGVLDLPVDARLAARLASFSPLPPVPPDPTNRVADDPSAALLGQALFFDERLSANGRVSCATCHDPDRGFTDGRELAFGLAEGRRKTPTLWNAAHHRWLTWDGRADSLWMQALDPIEDPTEMGATRTDVARIVRDDEDLRALYEASLGALPEALPEGLTSPS
ncbi:MAG: cytochrome-c peroxidase, partial [Planctomycetota bacterium]